MEGSTTGGNQMPMPGGQILPQLIMEAKAASGLDIHHEGEESDEQKVKDMIENYTSHLLQQQKQKATASSQQFRPFMPSGPPPGPPPTSHSHPCLFTIDGNKNGKSDEFRQSPFNSGEQNQIYEAKTYTNGGPIFYQEAPPANTTPPNTVMIKVADLTALRNENEILKKKNDNLEQKIGRLRQLEQAYDRIEKEFEQVLNQREQQEKIEKMALNKMEQHIQRLTLENSALNQRIEALSNSGNLPQGPLPPTQSDNMQLAQLTMLLNEYVAQNKELQSANDRQKIEIDAQNVTLTEQTNHIVMLEKALSNAQERLATKDRQLMDSNVLVEKCNNLQKLLQESIEDRKRQEEYMKEKAKLEMDFTLLKIQKENSRKNKTSPESEDASGMKRVLALKDDKIAQLEAMIIQIQKKYGEDNQKKEIMLKAEIENLNSRYRKLELEKLEKDRKMQELLNDNRRLHEQLAEERHSMDRRFSVLEENVRRLAVGRASTSSNPLYSNSPQITSITKQYQVSGFTPMTGAMSVSSLQHFEKDPTFIRQRNFSIDPAIKMEEMRKNIAERRNQQRSLSKPRGTPQVPHQSTNGGHYRTSSGPSSVIHSTKLNDFENQIEMERQIADYMANLPPATRRKFVVATGLSDKDFLQNYQVQNVSSGFSEGTKFSLSRQISKGSNSSSKKQITSLTPTDPTSEKDGDSGGIRIHLIEPSTERKIQSDDSEEINSRSGSSTTPSEPDEPQTPASGVSAASFSSNQVRNSQIYTYEIQPPQTITQIHTTTVVEVNKDQLGSKLQKKNQRLLHHQPSSDPTGGTDNPR